MAEELIFGQLLAFVEVGVKGLRVGELFFPAFPTATAFHVIDGEELVLRYFAARTLAPTAILSKHSLPNTPRSFSGLLSDALVVL
jgi:hypothetical protein